MKSLRRNVLLGVLLVQVVLAVGTAASTSGTPLTLRKNGNGEGTVRGIIYVNDHGKQKNCTEIENYGGFPDGDETDTIEIVDNEDHTNCFGLSCKQGNIKDNNRNNIPPPERPRVRDVIEIVDNEDHSNCVGSSCTPIYRTKDRGAFSSAGRRTNDGNVHPGDPFDGGVNGPNYHNSGSSGSRRVTFTPKRTSNGLTFDSGDSPFEIEIRDGSSVNYQSNGRGIDSRYNAQNIDWSTLLPQGQRDNGNKYLKIIQDAIGDGGNTFKYQWNGNRNYPSGVSSTGGIAKLLDALSRDGYTNWRQNKSPSIISNPAPAIDLVTIIENGRGVSAGRPPVQIVNDGLGGLGGLAGLGGLGGFSSRGGFPGGLSTSSGATFEIIDARNAAGSQGFDAGHVLDGASVHGFLGNGATVGFDGATSASGFVGNKIYVPGFHENGHYTPAHYDNLFDYLRHHAN